VTHGTARDSSRDEDTETDAVAMAALLTSLLGLILPVVPAIVAVGLARRASRRIQAGKASPTNRSLIRGAYALAALNVLIVAGILVAAAQLR